MFCPKFINFPKLKIGNIFKKGIKFMELLKNKQMTINCTSILTHKNLQDVYQLYHHENMGPSAYVVHLPLGPESTCDSSPSACCKILQKCVIVCLLLYQ